MTIQNHNDHVLGVLTLLPPILFINMLAGIMWGGGVSVSGGGGGVEK